jgi:hypothetical protein
MDIKSKASSTSTQKNRHAHLHKIKMSLPAPVLPTCFALQPYPLVDGKFLYLRGGHAESEEYVQFRGVYQREALTSSMNTRFYLVPSKEHGDEQLVHIKTSYNNKYLVAKKVESKSERMMSTADEPDEKKLSESCTLFKIKEIVRDYTRGRLIVRYVLQCIHIFR